MERRAYTDARTSCIALEGRAFEALSRDLRSASLWNSSLHAEKDIQREVTRVAMAFKQKLKAASNGPLTPLLSDCLLTRLTTIGQTAMQANNFLAVKTWQRDMSRFFSVSK